MLKSFQLVHKFLIKQVGNALQPFLIGIGMPGLFDLLDVVNDPYRGILVTAKYGYGKPKILRKDGGLRTKNFKADDLFQQYHRFSFIGDYDFRIRSGEQMECTEDLLVNLDNNDYAEINNVECEVLQVKYSDNRKKATIYYREPFNYAGTVELLKIG